MWSTLYLRQCGYLGNAGPFSAQGGVSQTPITTTKAHLWSDHIPAIYRSRTGPSRQHSSCSLFKPFDPSVSPLLTKGAGFSLHTLIDKMSLPPQTIQIKRKRGEGEDDQAPSYLRMYAPVSLVSTTY